MTKEWDKLEETRRKQTLEEYWNWEMSVFDATEEQKRQYVESQKSELLEMYSQGPFPAFEQSSKEDVWECINKSKCLVLPFSINQVKKMAREELIQIGEKYFGNEYTEEDTLDEIREELLTDMSSLNLTLNL